MNTFIKRFGCSLAAVAIVVIVAACGAREIPSQTLAQWRAETCSGAPAKQPTRLRTRAAVLLLFPSSSEAQTETILPGTVVTVSQRVGSCYFDVQTEQDRLASSDASHPSQTVTGYVQWDPAGLAVENTSK